MREPRDTGAVHQDEPGVERALRDTGAFLTDLAPPRQRPGDCSGRAGSLGRGRGRLRREGRTGAKSGAGFLEYPDEEREQLLLERDRRYAALAGLLERLPPVEAGTTKGDE